MGVFQFSNKNFVGISYLSFAWPWLAHPIHLDSISLVRFSGLNVTDHLVRIFLPLSSHSSLSITNFLLSTLFSNIANLCSFSGGCKTKFCTHTKIASTVRQWLNVVLKPKEQNYNSPHVKSSLRAFLRSDLFSVCRECNLYLVVTFPKIWIFLHSWRIWTFQFFSF